MKISSQCRSLALAIPAVTLMNPSPAAAHPHVWVVVRDTIVFKNGAVSGVQHSWTFDDAYTAMAIEGLDTNNDGKYDRAELQPLAQTNIDGLHEFENFTYAHAGDKKLAFSAPRDYWLEYPDGKLTLHFYLPFAEPIQAPVSELKIKVEDPSYFIAFEFAKDNAVALSDGAPKTCSASLGKGEVNPDDQALAEAFATEMVSVEGGVASVINVACSK